MEIWTAQQAQEATGGELRGPKSWSVFSISIDSRTTRKGDLFIALRGTKTDGHDYIREAFLKGAAAIMVETLPNNFPATAPVIVVDDCIEALQKLAKHRRAASEAKIIAVTGSVGKTSTKEMLNVVFSSLGLTHVSSGNNNNEIGVPLSLAKMPLDVDYGIFEMGMNHANEIAELTEFVKPHIAIITNVEEVHIENFAAGIEGIADAKAEIFAGLTGEKPIAILNKDNQFFDKLSTKAKRGGAKEVISFGEDFMSDIRLVDYTQSPTGNVVHCKIGFEEFGYHISARGKHMAINSLAVLGAVKAVGANVKEAASALSSFSAQKGRGQILHIETEENGKSGGKIFVIDESYNASPVSVRAALANLGDMTISGKKIAVIGDMLELGDKAAQMHESLAADVLRNGIDKVYTVGELAKNLFNALPTEAQGKAFTDASETVPELAKIIQAGDAILFKASNGTGLAKCVESLSKMNEMLHSV